MQQKLFEGNGIVNEKDLKPKGGININPMPMDTMVTSIRNLGSISKEEDLKVRPGINLNPPPSDGRCDGCGRLLSQLKPFGKAGDPLVGDFDGALLVKKYRAFAPRTTFYETIWDEFFRNCSTASDFQKAEEKLAQKYVGKNANNIIGYIEAASFVSASWECRDCIVLGGCEFAEKSRDYREQPERCDCCGRLLGGLKPFTERDPVARHFNGKQLARRYRPDALPTEEVNKMMDELFGNCITYDDHDEACGKLIQKYGREEALKLWTFAFFLDGSFQSSWECRDCIALDTHQYFGKKVAQQQDSGPDSPG